MADKKYKVADGVALTVKGVVLGAGEAIPENALEDSTIQTLVKAKKIVEDKGDASTGSASKSDEKKADDKKSDEKKSEEKK